ncbi:aminotransferase class V, partial [Staphylococcus aureus]
IIKDELKNRFKIAIAGRKGHLKGQTLRIGHMRKISRCDVLSIVSDLKSSLTEYRKFNYIGKGISNYMEVIHETINCSRCRSH